MCAYTLPPETNIAPETLGLDELEDEFPFGARPPGRRYASFGECTCTYSTHYI